MTDHDVRLVVSGDTGNINVLGPPEAVAAIEQIVAENRALTDERDRLLDGMGRAWGVIANAGEGDWLREGPEWIEAATRWRDEEWHPALDRLSLEDQK